ncbi:MAG: hypothetical protein M0010_09195 [Actinomycetota bacterium]|jgi:hypothetical protein|nr:hypothetical protein [Actinomycetota bacterium]
MTASTESSFLAGTVAEAPTLVNEGGAHMVRFVVDCDWERQIPVVAPVAVGKVQGNTLVVGRGVNLMRLRVGHQVVVHGRIDVAPLRVVAETLQRVPERSTIRPKVDLRLAPIEFVSYRPSGRRQGSLEATLRTPVGATFRGLIPGNVFVQAGTWLAVRVSWPSRYSGRAPYRLVDVRAWAPAPRTEVAVA